MKCSSVYCIQCCSYTAPYVQLYTTCTIKAKNHRKSSLFCNLYRAQKNL